MRLCSVALSAKPGASSSNQGTACLSLTIPSSPHRHIGRGRDPLVGRSGGWVVLGSGRATTVGKFGPRVGAGSAGRRGPRQSERSVANEQAGVVFKSKDSSAGLDPSPHHKVVRTSVVLPLTAPGEQPASLAIHKTIPPSDASHRYNLGFTDRIEGL